MTEKAVEVVKIKTDRENKFEKKQPLRHPLAAVSLENDRLKINKQLYQVMVNKEDALDLEVLSQKYDPYLDQYDYLVGDVSSEHLRLKGFYKDNVQTAIDRKEQTIADYLMEYCNPGGPYFILQLLSPVHHYRNNNRKKWGGSYRKRKKGQPNKKNGVAFKRYKIRPTHYKKPETVAVKKEQKSNHTFVIKKRKGSK